MVSSTNEIVYVGTEGLSNTLKFCHTCAKAGIENITLAFHLRTQLGLYFKVLGKHYARLLQFLEENNRGFRALFRA